ncbi:AraC family transcriptional regulator [Streptosporangium sp. NPDC023615]|uniref:helix-turn-helix transcriptional regulator n=1 Tax=Streptosporangium sp. NPDC023615 TaxID=3154794 RepID=UPI0034363F27
MCHPGWARALTAARHLDDLARLRRVRDRIDREYARPLDIEALARGVDMPAGHLGHRFRLAYGRSPHAYLTARRIERAMALLCRVDLDVTEVCAAVGYSSPGSFATRFTELVGTAPGAFTAAGARPAGTRAAGDPARPAPSGAGDRVWTAR